MHSACTGGNGAAMQNAATVAPMEKILLARKNLIVYTLPSQYNRIKASVHESSTEASQKGAKKIKNCAFCHPWLSPLVVTPGCHPWLSL
jgi:hypothetical protein